jgi:DNA/RNA-binding domain of Phe-tRNA-synthetase-like protein
VSETGVFQVTSGWKAAYPDAHAGILAMRNVDNRPSSPGLERRKQELEDALRTRFAGQDRRALDAIPAIQAYNSYYRQFKKSYHVEAQLESIAFKGRAIPNVGAVVTAMFMAEVQNLLLTAGHDLDSLQLPVRVAVAAGDESYTLLRGQEQALKAGDMLMADRAGVISSIIYGPDQRTQIRADTHNVLFAVYAPAGIAVEAVRIHLQEICDYVRMVSPVAVVQICEVF